MTNYSITCAEPGCTNQIWYTSEDTEIPIYCTNHRTCEGRHAAKKQLKKMKVLNEV